MSEEKSKTRFELMVEMVKALAWPVFAFIILLSFWTPLREASRTLPGLLRRSEAITIAGLTIKLQGELRAKASPEVEQALARLSPEDIEELLNFRFVGCWDADSTNIQQIKDRYGRLVQSGLLVEVADMGRCASTQGVTYEYALGPSPLGVEAQKFLFALLAAFLHELGSAPPPRD